MSKLRKTTTKYNVLLNRLAAKNPANLVDGGKNAKFLEKICPDDFCKDIGLTDELMQTK